MPSDSPSALNREGLVQRAPRPISTTSGVPPVRSSSPVDAHPARAPGRRATRASRRPRCAGPRARCTPRRSVRGAAAARCPAELCTASPPLVVERLLEVGAAKLSTSPMNSSSRALEPAPSPGRLDGVDRRAPRTPPARARAARGEDRPQAEEDERDEGETRGHRRRQLGGGKKAGVSRRAAAPSTSRLPLTLGAHESRGLHVLDHCARSGCSRP